MIVVLWITMAFVVGAIAASKGFSGFGWFLYGLLIWPIALVHVLVTKPETKFVEQQALASGGKKCPRCAEIVKSEARSCRYCAFDFGLVTKTSIETRHETGVIAAQPYRVLQNAARTNTSSLIFGAFLIVFGVVLYSMTGS